MRSFVTLCILLYTLSAQAQLTGYIRDKDGEALPFGTVHIKGTTAGTTANAEGRYQLDLQPGDYELVYQYIGYRAEHRRVQYDGQPRELHIRLEEETYNIRELVISANAEDPAYAVIRKAMEKRPYYKNLIDAYACKVYIKGKVKMLETPTRFMGQDLGDMDGILDSSRQGILYLSESETKYFYQKPDKRKEIMVSSKVSGDDNGFSFNRASAMDFNFYETDMHFFRPIVNPIASNAFNYYRYKLLQSYYDEENRLINKIEVIPRRGEDPVFRGIIYIVENTWQVHSVDMYLTRNAMKMDLFDTAWVRQQYVPVGKSEYWPLFSQTMSFKAGLLVFKVGGEFTAVYTDYDLSPRFEPGFFNKEALKVESEANQKDSSYWENIRPIPLTEEESHDYVRKDSLAILHKSKPYLDSVDRVSNRFKFNDLLTGYTYRRSYQGWSLSSDLKQFSFNAVQGWTAGYNGTFRKTWEENSAKKMQSLQASAGFQYGFSDAVVRYSAGLRTRLNTRSRTTLYLNGGNEVTDINSEQTLNNFYNAWAMLFNKISYKRFYERKFVEAGGSAELWNGWRMNGQIGWAQRAPMVNRTNYSFKKKEESYAPNDDLKNVDRTLDLGQNSIWQADLSLVWVPGQRYISYPNRKINLWSPWPTITGRYQAGLDPQAGGIAYQLLRLGIRKDVVLSNVWGALSFNVEGGVFLNRPRYFFDYKHFIGAETPVMEQTNYLRGFKLLPFYSHSTDRGFVQSFLEWNDNSFLFDKIPLLRKLGFNLIYGASYLYTPDRGQWMEGSISIGRIGWHIFRPFRVDFVWAWSDWQYERFGVRLAVINLSGN